MKAAMTFEELQAFIASVLTPDKSGNAAYTPSFANTLALLDKIGKTIEIPQAYIDKLGELDGEFLNEGKIVEEYYRDLVLPGDPAEGADEATLADYTPSARLPYYSYTIDEKVIEVTRKYNDLERAFNDPASAAKAITGIMKSMQDSTLVYRYGLKKQLLGNVIKLALSSQTDAVVFAKATAYQKGAYVKDAATATKYGVIFNVYTSNAATSWADAVTKGYIVELDLITTLTDPTADEASGAAFIQAVKTISEVASDNSQGHSLSGGTLGVQSNAFLYIKQGIMPSLEVKTMAGAFQLNKISLPIENKVVRDFGDADSSVFAVIVDTRGVKLHPSCDYVLDNTNGRKGWVSYFRHLQFTPFISRNTFVKVFKKA